MNWSDGAGAAGASEGQLSLFGLPPARFNDRLFFALFPDAPAVEAIVRHQGQSGSSFGINGHPHRADRLHVTLVHIDDYESLPKGVVEAAGRAADALREPPIELSFDRLASFNGALGHCPFVLRAADDANPGLIAFQHALRKALMKAGLKYQSGSSFTPHVTLLYGDLAMLSQAIEPIGWTASEFVLVHSLLGKGVYNILGRWPLLG
jgi:2'-5' RNA ligase